MRRASAGTGVVGLLLLGVVALVGSASPAAAAIGDINTFADAGVIDPDQMAAADDGTMWFTATAVVGSISPSGTIATSNDATIIGGTRDVTVGGDDSVWFSTSTGLVRRDPGTGTFAAIPIAGDAPTLLTTTSDGDVWFVDEGNDVWSIPSDGDTTTPTLEEDLDPSTGDEVISDMAPDLAGGIWAVQPAGSLGSLLHVDAGGPLTATILTEDSKVAGQGTRLAVAPDGTVYIIGTDDGVYQIWNAPGAPARLRFRASSRSWTRVCARSTMATSRGFGATS